MSAPPGPAALELHDIGVRFAGHPALDALEPSPGIALVERDRVVTGRAAAERARLEPRRVHRGFWAELGLEPLGRPFPPDLRPADLAFHQLDDLWRRARAALDAGEAPDGVLLVAPGSFALPQLELALGIARRCGIPVSGCVDAALAAAAGREGERFVHLDLELGRAVASELAVEGSGEARELVRRRVEREERVGLVPLHDAWAREIARLFVIATRFDPLHLAATEQELYLRLPGWLSRLAEQESIEVTMRTASRLHSIELERPRLAAAAALAYERLAGLTRAMLAAAGEGARLLVSHRLQGLPGLQEHLGTAAVALDADAALAGALRHAALIHHPGEETLPFVLRLPAAPEHVPA